MLLKELIQSLNLKISLSELANKIEIDDTFSNNPVLEKKDNEINIYCDDSGITRVVNFNFDKKTISELATDTLFVSGTVYSIDGKLIKIIN